MPANGSLSELIRNSKKSSGRARPSRNSGSVKWYRKRWVVVTGIILLSLFILGFVVSWKTGITLKKITKGDASLFGNLYNSLASNQLQGEENGRINVALLGMRGEGVAGGGTLADTIMVISIKPQENKVALLSVPRDLYVAVPGTSDRQKINAVYHYGEKKGKGQGLENMKTILKEVSGQEIHYAVATNFAGFEQLVDTLGGITIELSEPFSESVQFNQPQPCDGRVFKESTGKFQEKQVLTSIKSTGERNYKTVMVPLCVNTDKECGGDFSLPAGENHLNGEQALCYARSRVTSNDFQRARRQQEVLKVIKKKLISIGTLADFGKINDLFDALGDNVRSDMELWEMKRLFEVYQDMPEPQVFQKVFENSEDGLLYTPQDSGGAGYILLPRGDNYDRIHRAFEAIFE